MLTRRQIWRSRPARMAQAARWRRRPDAADDRVARAAGLDVSPGQIRAAALASWTETVLVADVADVGDGIDNPARNAPDLPRWALAGEPGVTVPDSLRSRV